VAEHPTVCSIQGGDELKKADLAIACSLTALCIYILNETSFYPAPIVEDSPGAGLFPNVLAICLIVLSIILFINGLRKRIEDTDSTNWKALGKIGLSATLIIAFLVVLHFWDIFILIPLLLAPIMVIMGERNVKAIIALPIIFDLFVYVVFYRIFKVMLPTIYF